MLFSTMSGVVVGGEAEGKGGEVALVSREDGWSGSLSSFEAGSTVFPLSSDSSIISKVVEVSRKLSPFVSMFSSTTGSTVCFFSSDSSKSPEAVAFIFSMIQEVSPGKRRH